MPLMIKKSCKDYQLIEMLGHVAMERMEKGIAKEFKLRFVILNQGEHALIRLKKMPHTLSPLFPRERGWGIEKVKKHQDFSNKYCPHRTLDKGWNGFIQMIKSYLNDIPVASSSGFIVGEKVRVKRISRTVCNRTRTGMVCERLDL